jgi:hypothetical protein
MIQKKLLNKPVPTGFFIYKVTNYLLKEGISYTIVENLGIHNYQRIDHILRNQKKLGRLLCDLLLVLVY